jgi:hypothetical protein
VVAIPVREIRKSRTYLSIEFYKDKNAKHELKCFLREVCSENALKLRDIVAVTRESKECFSPNLYKYIDSLTDKQLSTILESFILKVWDDGYSKTIKYHEAWKCVCRKEQAQPNDNFFIKIFKKLAMVSYNFYYYDNNYVNVYTTPDEDLPIYLNHTWLDEEDKKVYDLRIKKLDSINKGNKKPILNPV